jgi:putative spermidine/putrescine transport system permease protein
LTSTSKRNLPSRAEALAVLPAFAVILVLFVGGIGFAFAESLRTETGLGIDHYARLLADPEFVASLFLTMRVAALSTLLAAVGGVLLALGVRQSALWHSMLLQIPIAMPHLAFAVTMLFVLAPSGLIARSLRAVGIPLEPANFPVVVQDSFGWGIILVYVLKEMPFLATLCLGALVRLEPSLDDAARTLGASRWDILRRVTLPLILPVLAAGSAVAFAFVFSAFEVPYLMGRPFPAMLGVVAQRRFVSGDLADRPEALALAVVTSLAAALAIAICVRVARGSVRDV